MTAKILRFSHPARRRQRPTRFNVSIIPMLVLVCVAVAASYLFERSGEMTSTAVPPAYFSACGGGPRISCVVDGDTIWADGEKIRLADIDAPEVFSPDCSAEHELGRQATLRLAALLNEGPVELRKSGSRDFDKYGRSLRVVRVNGRSVGKALVAEGLAQEWGSRQRSWCA